MKGELRCLSFSKPTTRNCTQKKEKFVGASKRDYNIVVSAHQNLLTDYYKLKDELEEERNNHDRLQDYAVEMDKREESLKAQVRELRSFCSVKEETV